MQALKERIQREGTILGNGILKRVAVFGHTNSNLEGIQLGYILETAILQPPVRVVDQRLACPQINVL